MGCIAIINATALNESDLKLIIDASIDAGVRGIQTGNGFGEKITPKKIQSLLPLIKGRCSIKAAGGIKSIYETLDLIKSGCSEIGTSFGPQLTKEFKRINS